jgi:hypothetical protein
VVLANLFYPGGAPVKPVLMLHKRGARARAGRTVGREERGEPHKIAILKRATVSKREHLWRLF